MSRRLHLSLVAAVSLWTTLFASPALAQRQSGVQVTPDGRRTLVSKDVNGERWAITRDLDDLTVTGNVFFPAGGDPLFVYCAQTGEAGEELAFDCFGADKCGMESCPEFTFLAPVMLPESFFSVPGVASSSVGEAIARVLGGEPKGVAGAPLGVGERQSGVPTRTS